MKKSLKSHTLQRTSRPHLFRNCDLNGDWKEYYNSKTKMYKRALTSVLDRAYPKGFGFYDALKKATPDEWDRRLSESGDRGDAIHQLIAKALNGEKVHIATHILAENNKDTRKPTLGEWQAFLSFADFVNAHGVKLIVHEETVEAEQFIGTLDQLWVLTKPCGRDKRSCKCADFLNLVGLNDVKTGKGLYPNHESQVALLAHADFSHLRGVKVVDYTMLLHLNGTERGWSAKFYDKAATELAYFRGEAAFTIDDRDYKPFDPATDIEDIPKTVAMNVEKFVAPKPKKLPKKPGKGVKAKVVKQ